MSISSHHTADSGELMMVDIPHGSADEDLVPFPMTPSDSASSRLATPPTSVTKRQRTWSALLDDALAQPQQPASRASSGSFDMSAADADLEALWDSLPTATTSMILNISNDLPEPPAAVTTSSKRTMPPPPLPRQASNSQSKPSKPVNRSQATKNGSPSATNVITQQVAGSPSPYSPEERREKIKRFLEKRGRRVWKKEIKYSCRKQFAETRPRVGGRFVSKPSTPEEKNATTTSSTPGESTSASTSQDNSKAASEKQKSPQVKSNSGIAPLPMRLPVAPVAPKPPIVPPTTTVAPVTSTTLVPKQPEFGVIIRLHTSPFPLSPVSSSSSSDEGDNRAAAASQATADRNSNTKHVLIDWDRETFISPKLVNNRTNTASVSS